MELEIIWTTQAKSALKLIFEFYKNKSLSGAKNVKNDILNSVKTIRFSEQFQVDNINNKYRRIVIRDYKVLYRNDNNRILIMDIISTKQSPSVLENL